MSRRHLYGLLFAVCFTLATGPAHAADDDATAGLGTDAQPGWLQLRDDERPPRDPPPPNPMQWYGWQTLIADSVAFGSLTMAVLIRDESAETTLARFALGSFVLGPPTVHIVHGRFGPALGSLALRIAPILLGVATLSCAFSSPFSSSGSGTCSLLGGLTMLSIAVPVVLDTGYFAWEKRPREPTVHLAPWATRNAGGLTLARAF